ncbi:hypothetical protein GCM10010112_84990 [Actinoplanes lobatus]|uniref:Uncharacterized protein n=1 Tax=Actinoplanes lobatus TaxID=113568 RepID=A0A7W7HKU8_9ACTN|nr:hypothetical protein [Actinoplanes lobatus]MBB4752406.1 hypothetical protein [Actinoplanes lobatus]GGN95077.1 hypothetical protein GCM10010112_84990 [Actinoplanes lobatus]GIE46115.1 hypothetical protein Alo02nite_90130 [Actinoplanes lobatus]
MADLLQLLDQLLTVSHHGGPEDIAAAATRFAPLVDAQEMVVYLVDYGPRHPRPLPGPDTLSRDPIAVDGTLPGRPKIAARTPCRGVVIRSGSSR